MTIKKKPAAVICPSPNPSPNPPTVEKIVTVLLANERERVVRDATKLIKHIEINLTMMRDALQRDDLQSFSRFAEPFDEAIAARAELLGEFDRTIKRARDAKALSDLPAPATSVQVRGAGTMTITIRYRLAYGSSVLAKRPDVQAWCIWCDVIEAATGITVSSDAVAIFNMDSAANTFMRFLLDHGTLEVPDDFKELYHLQIKNRSPRDGR